MVIPPKDKDPRRARALARYQVISAYLALDPPRGKRKATRQELSIGCETTEKLIRLLRSRGHEVVTRVEPAAKFWKAEAYHQDYYQRTGTEPYCHSRVRRFGD